MKYHDKQMLICTVLFLFNLIVFFMPPHDILLLNVIPIICMGACLFFVFIQYVMSKTCTKNSNCGKCFNSNL